MIVTAAALALAAGQACAATPTDAFSQQQAVDAAPQPNQIGPQPPHRTLQWDARKGRWGLNFDMTQSPDRDVRWGGARIGLNYRVAPGLRTGVGVTIGEEAPPDVRRLAPSEPAPRVRLETTFKF
jgi:hypothetical protein